MITPDERCTATSKTTGKRCRRLAHPGYTRCFLHGGPSYYEIHRGDSEQSRRKVSLDDEWAEMQQEERP